LIILALILISGVIEAQSRHGLAIRIRRVWQSLIVAGAGGFACVSVAGYAVSQLGANPNAIFVSARYLWCVLGWGAIAAGFALGSRTRVATVSERGGTLRARRDWGQNWLYAAALAAFLFRGARLFIPDEAKPWSLPYTVADWIFDDNTTGLASDECLALRTVDDTRRWGTGSPSLSAIWLLKKRGVSAAPGIVAFLNENLTRPQSWHGYPWETAWLLAEVAKAGDNPILEAYERYPYLESGKMRQCIHAGRHVVWKSGPGWSCEP